MAGDEHRCNVPGWNIYSRTAEHLVVTVIAAQVVAFSSAIKRVIAKPAIENIRPCAAGQQVVARLAKQFVWVEKRSKRTPRYRVVARTTQGITQSVKRDDIIAITAVRNRPGTPPEKGVVVSAPIKVGVR